MVPGKAASDLRAPEHLIASIQPDHAAIKHHLMKTFSKASLVQRIKMHWMPSRGQHFGQMPNCHQGHSPRNTVSRSAATCSAAAACSVARSSTSRPHILYAVQDGGAGKDPAGGACGLLQFGDACHQYELLCLSRRYHPSGMPLTQHPFYLSIACIGCRAAG